MQLLFNFIQNFHLGRYIVGFIVRNFVFMISGHKTDDIPPQIKILNKVIRILMHFLKCIRQKHSILHQIYASSATYNQSGLQRNITEYAVANY